MRNYFLLVVALIVTFVSFNTMAEEKPLEFKLNSATDTIYDKDKSLKIVVKDLQGGVFVTVRSGWSTVYPKTAKLIGELMTKQGIKITDDPAKADYGIQFGSVYGFNFEDIETQASSGGGLDAGKVGAIIGGGVFGLISVLSSSNTDKPVKAILNARSVIKPTLNSRGNVEGDANTMVGETIEYQTNKTGVEVSNAIFAVFISEFIKNHFVLENTVFPSSLDTNSSNLSGASAVPAAPSNATGSTSNLTN